MRTQVMEVPGFTRFFPFGLRLSVHVGPLLRPPSWAIGARMVELKKAKLEHILKIRDVRTLSEDDILWLIKEFNTCLEEHSELQGKYKALVSDEIKRLQRERDFEEGCG